MNYNVEKGAGSVKIDFTLTAAEWEDEIQKAYLATRGKFNIPGFRKGHATRKVIESMYGKGVFFDDAFNECFKRVYYEALSQNPDIFPVDDPKVDFGDMNDKKFSFSATVTVKPEVKLGNYKGLTIERSKAEVSQEEITAEIDRARERASRNVEITDRAVKDGDTVKLDYSGSVDGVAFDGGTAKDQELVIGSKTFIPGFEEQMIGMSVGETKDLKVNFPADYHSKELAGKDAVFNVTLHGITVKEVPQLSEEFVKEVSKFDTVADFTKDIESKIRERKQNSFERESENELLKAIAAGIEVDVPKCMIDSELDYMVQDFGYQLTYMYGGMKLEDYFKYTGTTESDFRKQRSQAALDQVRTRLALEEIIKQEKIEVDEKELDEELDKVAGNSGKDPDKYKSEISDKQRSYIKSDLLMKKVMEFLKANNTFVEKKEKSAAGEKKEKSSENGQAAKKTASAKSAAKKTEGGESPVKE